MNLIGKAKSLRFFDPDLPPPHMDKWTRNARAAEWLVGMGFYVERVPDEKRPGPDSIDHLIVSVSLPERVYHEHDQG